MARRPERRPLDPASSSPRISLAHEEPECRRRRRATCCRSSPPICRSPSAERPCRSRGTWVPRRREVRVTCSWGTALTPPLFLAVVLCAGAAAARSEGRRGRIGAGLVSLVAVAFMAGSTANLRNDVAAARAAGTPVALTVGLAAIHLGLSIGLLYNALPRLRHQGPRRAGDVRRQPA